MIEIIFVGLIAHVLTSGGEQRAVFIAAPTHAARLILRADDVIEMRGFHEIASTVPGERIIDLSGEHVSVETGTQRPAVRTAAMREHIVSLASISDGTALRDEVERGESFDGASAYLDLRGGVLDVDEQSVMREIAYHLDRPAAAEAGPRPMRGQAAHDDVIVCAAYGIRYTAPVASDAVVLTGTGGAVLRLRPGAIARAENLPPAIRISTSAR